MTTDERYNARQEGLELIATADLPLGIEAMMPDLIEPLAEIDTLATLVLKRIETEMAEEKTYATQVIHAADSPAKDAETPQEARDDLGEF